MAQVTVTDPARDYLAQLIEKQDVEGMGVRIFVTQPGTKNAETCLAYCPPNEVVPTDEQVDLDKFVLYLDHNSVPFLEEAYVDYSKDQMGGQLTIKAPNAKVEGYVFVAFCFWVFCFGISRYSQNLERKLDTGHKT